MNARIKLLASVVFLANAVLVTNDACAGGCPSDELCLTGTTCQGWDHRQLIMLCGQPPMGQGLCCPISAACHVPPQGRCNQSPYVASIGCQYVGPVPSCTGS
jgi:hypothetical protein